MEGSKLLLADKRLLPVAIVHIDGKRLIGPSDPYATGLGESEEAIAFRNAIADRYQRNEIDAWGNVVVAGFAM